MVQQTIDSKFSKYRLANTETGSPKHDKQQRVPLAAKKPPPLQDLQNENRNMVPKSGASSQNLKESGPVVETLKVSGSKRTQSECLVKSSRYQSPTSNVNGHLVYVRRKPEPESGKSNTSHDNKSNRADSAQSRNHDVQDQRIQQQSHAKDSRTCTSQPVPVPRASSEGLSSTKPSVSLAPGKSNIISPPAMNCTSEPVPVPRASSEGLSSTKPSVSLASGKSNIISPPAMNCTSEPLPVPRASSESLLPTKPSVSLAPGKSNIISTPAEPNVNVTPAISSVDHSKRSRVQHWEERYGRLQNLLRILDQSDQEDYLQMFRPLSSVDLSRLAVELEKRSIQLSLEEGLQADHTVHMVRGSAPAASAPTTGTPSVQNPSTTPGVTQGVAPGLGVGFGGAGLGGASLFPGLGGSAENPLFGAGLPEFEQMQQQLTQNPNMMRDIMSMPAIQNLMNNPELMRGLIMSNPQMRDIIDRNPELAHVLNDPSILRQTLEAARNPELMREMMRNTDRAMSNIESSPEGFNMLRRMYENVQEPFLNATTMGGGPGNDSGSNPFAALLGNQGAGTQTRDGSNNSSTTGTEAATGVAAPNANPLPNPWGGTGGNTQAHAGARPSPTGEVRPPSIGGLGGLGLPGLGSGGMPDMNQLMQNPAVSQMMQSLLSNPQYMNQILGQNPQLRSMLDSNPQLREMMQNPEVLRQLTSPEMMQQMMAMQQFLPQFNRQQATQDQAQTGGTTGTQNNMGLDLLMNMFGGGLGAGGLAVPNAPDVPPEQLYATQLSQLQEMGFFDTQENIRALRATSGNVHAAVERLLGNLGQ